MSCHRTQALLSTLIALVLAAPPLAAAGATLVLTDGVAAVEELRIGDTLHAGLEGADPGTEATLELVDEADRRVASRAVIADETGSVAAAPLWWRSGVVGCDPDVQADPSSYLFERFEQAESVLHGRVFRVLVRDAQDKVVAWRELPLRTDASVPRYFFSDGAACPRSYLLHGEDLYLSSVHADAGATEVGFFLVPAQPVWEPGMELREVRSQYLATPQVIVRHPAATSFSALAWVGDASVIGSYDGIVRQCPSWEYFLIPCDDVLDDGPLSIERDGIVITDWGCPDCDP